MAKYQGHASWNAWNVSLWINNDEGLYRLAQECIAEVRKSTPKHGTKKHMAYLMLNTLREDMGITHTPDGAPYSVSSIRAAMVGM